MTDRPTESRTDDTGSGPGAADTCAAAFVASLPADTTRDARELLLARIGAFLAIAGAVLAVIALVMSQASDNPLDQSTQLTMAVTGVALAGLGGVLFLRYSLGRLLRWWLLRILDETHRRDD